MAKLFGLVLPRKAPSLKGNLVVSSWRGIPYIAKWPKRRSRPLPESTQERNEWFRQANILTKYIDPELQITAMNAVKGTPLYPRDVQIQLMRGTLIGLNLGSEGKLFSLAVKQGVSDSLDVISQTQGGILYRAADIWDVLDPSDDGKVLTTHGPDSDPTWEAGGGGGGGLWEEIAEITAPVAGVLQLTGLTLTDYKVIKIFFSNIKPTVAEGYFDLTAFEGSLEITSGYKWATWLYNTSGFDRKVRDTSDPFLRLTTTGVNWGNGIAPQEGFNAQFTLMTPATASDRLCFWEGVTQHPTTNISTIRGAGRIANSAALVGFKLANNVNAIDSGEMKIIGMK